MAETKYDFPTEPLDLEPFKVNTYTAYKADFYSPPEYPGWYKRTFMLAIAFGPFIAGLAGLFNLNVDVWVLRQSDGMPKAWLFRPFVFSKRKARP